MWFLLLFLAGITSSVSLAEPAVAFISDEFALSRRRAVGLLGVIMFLLCQLPIFFLGQGVVNELDFWGGTFCLVIFAAIEIVVFVWIFGIEKAWEEIHHGAEMRIPGFYKPIIRYVTPTFLLLIIVSWFFQQGLPVIMLEGVPDGQRAFIIGTRIGLIALFLLIAFFVRLAWYRRREIEERSAK